MSKSKRLKALLKTGYFPDELPPPFHTDDFAKFRVSVHKEWGAIPNLPPKTSPSIFTIPRTKHKRRYLALVNPISQLTVAKLIADNWVEIRKLLNKSKFAATDIDINFTDGRAVQPPDFPEIGRQRVRISSEYYYALVTDISRFYGTLYTHVIPWALYTKQWSKANMSTPAFKAMLGDKLDVAVRKGQDNQTMGIPVGPDTSRIISEIVAAAADEQIMNRLKLVSSQAVRNVDDWYIGFDTLGDTEHAINVLEATYRDFELELNPEKTACFEAPSVAENYWPGDLRAFKIPKKGKAQISSIERYFTQAFTHQTSNEGDSVLDYAVKRSRNFLVNKEAWATYEIYLLKAARANALSIPAVVQILSAYKQGNYPVGPDNCQKLVEDLIQKHAPAGHHSEVAWALFLAKSLQLSVSEKSCEAISGIENSVCALLTLDLKEEGLTPSGLDTAIWQLSMNSAGLKSDMWLLAYEADLKGWLGGTPANFVDQDQYFSILKKKKISFYDKMRSFELKPPKPRGRIVRYSLKKMKNSMDHYAFFALANSLFPTRRRVRKNR